MLDHWNRWQHQTKFYDPDKPGHGNCLEAALASLLDIPLYKVPKFWDDTASDTAMTYWDNFCSFCGKLGFEVVVYYMGLHDLSEEACLHIACGPSERGCDHAVVGNKFGIIWDPHPSGKGLLAVKHWYVLVPKDPSYDYKFNLYRLEDHDHG